MPGLPRKEGLVVLFLGLALSVETCSQKSPSQPLQPDETSDYTEAVTVDGSVADVSLTDTAIREEDLRDAPEELVPGPDSAEEMAEEILNGVVPAPTGACAEPPTVVAEPGFEPGNECSDGNDIHWDGCTSGKITEFRVNDRWCGQQGTPRVRGLGADSYAIIWEHFGPEYDNITIRGKVFHQDGEGEEFSVAAPVGFNTASPDLAVLPSGQLVAVWGAAKLDSDTKPWSVQGRLLSSTGEPLGGCFQVNSFKPDHFSFPQLAPIGNAGRFVVVWESCPPCLSPDDPYWDGCVGQDGNGCGIIAQLFDSQGNKMGSEFVVNDYTIGHQSSPTASPLVDVGVIVGWMSDGAYFYADAMSQILAPDGTELLTSEVLFDENQSNFAPHFAGTSKLLLAVWDNTPCSMEVPCGPMTSDNPPPGMDGEDMGVTGAWLEFQSGAFTLETVFHVNPVVERDQRYGDAVALSNGQFAVVWMSGQKTAGGPGLYGCVLTAMEDGCKNQFRVDSYPVGAFSRPRLAALGEARFVIAWSSISSSIVLDPMPPGQDGDGRGVFAQVFDHNGNRLWKNCNDGACGADETCSTCPLDCGQCP
jgi:hypothetical protein